MNNDAVLVNRLIRRLLVAVLLPLVVFTAMFGLWRYKAIYQRYHSLGEKDASLGARMVEYVLEKAIINGVFEEDVVFDQDYQLLNQGGGDLVYRTLYDGYFERNIQQVLVEMLDSPSIYYAYAINVDGYIPAHSDARFGKHKRSQSYRGDRHEWVDPEGFHYYEYSAPIVVMGRSWGYFCIGIPMGLIQAEFRSEVVTVALLLLVFIGIMVLMVRVMVQAGLRPLKELLEATRKMSAGDLHARCHYDGPDEVGALARSFNAMVKAVNVSREILEGRVAERTATLQKMMEENPAGIILVSGATRRVVQANRAALQMLKATKEQVVGQPCYRFICGRKDKTCPVLDDGQVIDTAEHELEQLDGGRLSILKNVVQIHLDGRLHLLETMTDISQQKKIEQNLRELSTQREALERIINRSPAIAFSWRAEDGWPVEYVSDNIQMLGYEPEELLSGRVAYCELVYPDDLAAVTEEVESYTREGRQVFDQEYRVLTRDGTVRWVEDRTWLILDQAGTVTHYQGLIWDITERKEAEAELLRIRAAVDDASDGVLVTDVNDNPLYANRAFGVMVGYTRTNLDADAVRAVLGEGAHVDRMRGDILEALEWRGEIDLVKSDRASLPVLLRASPVMNEQLDVQAISYIMTDLSEQRAVERERQVIEVQLRQAQKMEAVGQLAAGIAHEINTPAQFVGDNTRFFKDACADLMPFIQRVEERIKQGRPILEEELKEWEAGLETADWEYLREEIPKAIDQSLEGVKRVSRIVQAMKEFSHSGGGERTPVDINRAIKNTVTVARNEWKYVAEMKLELEDQLPPVICQPGEVNQVFLNMLVNAAHAVEDALKAQGTGGKGTITISTRVVDQWVETRVRDTGTGIPEAIHSRIFDPFFTTKEVGRGSGQGLSISYDIVVNKHNGQIDFETAPGKGTTFIIRLPWAKPDEEGTPHAENGAGV